MAQTPRASTIKMLRMLSSRLERLSADSLWARRASGVRRSLLREIDAIEAGEPVPARTTDLLIEDALTLLTRAAHEIPERHSDQVQSESDN